MNHFLAAASALLLVGKSWAQTFYEPFNYYAGASAYSLDGQGGWTDSGNTHVVAGNLSLPPGLPAAGGNSVQATPGAGAAKILDVPYSSGSVYFSYAFRLDSIGSYPSII